MTEYVPRFVVKYWFTELLTLSDAILCANFTNIFNFVDGACPYYFLLGLYKRVFVCSPVLPTFRTNNTRSSPPNSKFIESRKSVLAEGSHELTCEAVTESLTAQFIEPNII